MMKRLIVLGLLAIQLAAGAAQSAPSASAAATPAASAPASASASAAAPVLGREGTAPYMPPSTGSAVPATSFLQSMGGLLLVLGVLLGLAWLMRRFGPPAVAGARHLKLVGAVSLGGRERAAVLEVGDTWIVVGTAPGRVTALATLPKPATAETDAGTPAPAAPASFADWLQHTIKNRNAS